MLVYRVGESIAPVAATNANERSPVPSPDGKWIAYVSDTSGRDEIYLKGLDGSAEPLQLTSGGAVEPLWTREGIFYREGGRMMLSAIRSGVPGTIREIFEGQFERDPGANAAAYDVDRRGKVHHAEERLDAARAAGGKELDDGAGELPQEALRHHRPDSIWSVFIRFPRARRSGRLTLTSTFFGGINRSGRA